MDNLNIGNKGARIIQVCCAFILLLLIFIVLKAMGAPSQAETNILRQQFHLPKEIKFEKVWIDRKNRHANPPTIEAYVKFSQEEFITYQKDLNNANLWQPQPIQYDGHVFTGSYAPQTLSWVEKQEGAMVSWGNVSWKQVQEAKNAKIMCFAMRYPDSNNVAIAPYDSAPCSEQTRELDSAIIVQALLDEDNRTLHMLVRGVRPKR